MSRVLKPAFRLSIELVKYFDLNDVGKQGYTLKNWMEGISDEAYHPWESPKKIGLKSVSPTFTTKQKNVLIYGLKLTYKLAFITFMD